MQTDKPITEFSDIYRKVILEDGTLDKGILTFTRPYSFSLSGASFVSSAINVYSHTYDSNIYPSSYTTATGFGCYATSGNSFSGYFHTTLMQLFNQNIIHAINGPVGIYSTTSLTSSVTSAIYNEGMFNPLLFEGNSISLSSFTATVSSFYVYCFSRDLFGHRMLDGTIKLWAGNTLIAEENGIHRDSFVLSLSSSVYTSSLTGLTKFWVFPENGKIVVWSSSGGTLAALSGITNISFSNSVDVHNYTINVRLEADEYTVSDNQSFYNRYYTRGDLTQPRITTVGFYNPWGDLIAISKLPKPIIKSNIPIDFKFVLDFVS